MRTPEKFETIWKEMKWFTNFHKKPVWIVAVGDDYVLSIIKPKPHEIAEGTVANLYKEDGTIIDSVIYKK